MKDKSFGHDFCKKETKKSFSTDSIFEKRYLMSFFLLDAWSFCTALREKYFRNV